MKIRQRLALRFMIVSALVTGAILIFIYFFTRGFVHADFVDRLTQQSSLEVLHYASPEVKDIMPAGSFNLVNPSTAIYSRDKKLLHQKGDFQVSKAWVNFLAENNVFNAERGPYTTVGRQHIVNGKLYLVFVSDKDLPGEREMDFLVKATLSGWVISLILSYLTGLYFSGDALKPVKRVVEEVNQITEDHLSYRLKLDKEKHPIDEIDELIITFNALLNRIQKAFIAQKRFVQNASHELKTPLTAIMAEVELALARKRPVEEYQRTLEVVLQESERLTRTTQGLLTLARLEEGSSRSEMNNVRVKNLLEETLAAFHLHHADRKILFDSQIPDVYITANELLLQTALLNILDNAYKYSADEIHVSIQQSGEHLYISVADQGIGIPSQELQRIRSPLFRATNVVSIPGAGLGLSLVDRIISTHQGKLEIKSEEGKGTTCIVSLPLK
ncbi:MAG TPA: HAMP domain-containing sensor histidine kinase [Ohtaekwangia sp.]